MSEKFCLESWLYVGTDDQGLFMNILRYNTSSIPIGLLQHIAIFLYSTACCKLIKIFAMKCEVLVSL